MSTPLVTGGGKMCGDKGLLTVLKTRLGELAQENPALARAITPIICANYQSGRFANIAKNDLAFNPAVYVDRVGKYYQECHEIVRPLQLREESAWQPFYDTLRKWAHCALTRWHFCPGRGPDLVDHAQACATEAAIVILTKSFPYDVQFYPWTYRIVHFTCLRHINGKIVASQDANKQEVIPLDMWDDWLHNIADPKAHDNILQSEQRQDLLQAINRLASEARKQLILLYYFEDKSFAEIAVLMNRNINALYKLHHDALADLKAIWG